MKVILAFDGSPYSKQAARVLSQFSFVDGLQLYVLTVSVDPFRTSPANLQPWRPEWEQQQERFVAKHHAEVKDMFRHKCPDATVFHRHGDASAEILGLAKRIDANLIVLGAIGHSMIERALLGSVSDHVATHAKCSVLVVRPQPDGKMKDQPIKKLSLAYDGSDAARSVLSELSDLKWGQDVEMSVLTVAQQIDYLLADEFSVAAIDNEQEVFEAMQANCEYAAKHVAEIVPHVKSTVVKGHHVGDTIVRTLEENNSDLIMIGDARHFFMNDWLLGNTTKFVLRHAPCSVWISRNRREISESRDKDEASGIAS